MTETLNNIDLVKWLRVLAIVIFILNIATYSFMAYETYGDTLNNNDTLPFIVMQTGTGFVNALYSPAVLLALAEIVRIMRKKEGRQDA